METIKPILFHLVAVVISLSVAVVLITVLKVDNSIGQAAIALVMLALEKLIRSSPSIPVKDWVNE